MAYQRVAQLQVQKVKPAAFNICHNLTALVARAQPVFEAMHAAPKPQSSTIVVINCLTRAVQCPQPFFEAMHAALKPGGIVCTQAESLWYHMDIIKGLANMCTSVFEGGRVQYAYTTIPTYPR